MADEQEPTGSQVVGALVGATIGNIKGSGAGVTVGMTLFTMTLPFLGPFAFLPLVACSAGGAIGGTIIGAKIGSKGLGHAALMAAGMVGGDLLHNGTGLDADAGSSTSEVT